MPNGDQIDNQTVFGFEKHLFEYCFVFSPRFAKNLMRPVLICVKLGILGNCSYRHLIDCFRRTDNACLSFFSLLTESLEMRLFTSRTIRYCLILFNLGDRLQCHMSLTLNATQNRIQNKIQYLAQHSEQHSEPHSDLVFLVCLFSSFTYDFWKSDSYSTKQHHKGYNLAQNVFSHLSQFCQ